MAVGFRATSPSQHIGGTSKLRRRFALTAAAVVVIIGVVGALPFLYALPLIGMLTAWSASPDVGSDARALSPGSGNRIIGSLVLAALAVGGIPRSAATAPDHLFRDGSALGGRRPSVRRGIGSSCRDDRLHESDR